MKRLTRVALAAVTGLLCLAATTSCSDDEGGSVQVQGSTGSGEASGSGTATGSGTASGSGIQIGSSTPTGSLDPAVTEAAVQYKQYVAGQIHQIVDDVRLFTDAVRAGDVDAAQAAYAPSRQAWERIEPVAGLVPDIDAAVDARIDDFAGPDDPAWTGWHRLEYLLWETGDISDAGALADQLDADIASLQERWPSVDLPPLVVALGAQELIEEVSEGKIQGEEDRYSHTDLWDIAANVEGSEVAFELLYPSLKAVDPDLAESIEDGFADVEDLLAPYRDGDGWASYEELSEDDRTAMSAAFAGLAEDLSHVAGTLGIG